METATKNETEETVERLNSLLRAELTAMDLYRQAADSTDAPDRALALRALEEEHREAAEALRQQIASLGGEVAELAAVLDRSRDHWADVTLREVEEEGITIYESTLLDNDLDPETRALLQCHLLPKAKAHVPMLLEHFSA